MKVILKSFIQHQTSGIFWQLKYPSGNIHTIQFVFPLALCVVDMKGAHALCGMFDSYSNISRPCVIFDCKETDLDSPYVKCSDILYVEMKKNILFHSDQQLKVYSQHKLVDNAFFNVNIGGWK